MPRLIVNTDKKEIEYGSHTFKISSNVLTIHPDCNPRWVTSRFESGKYTSVYYVFTILNGDYYCG